LHRVGACLLCVRSSCLLCARAFLSAHFAQIPIEQLLKKYDGTTPTFVRNEKRRMRIAQPPKLVVFSYRRFSRNYYTAEKNPTIVQFPLKGLDLTSCACRSMLAALG